MSEPEREPAPAPFSGRAAFAISQSYDYLAAVIGVSLLLGGVIEALIGVRQLVLPLSSGGDGPVVESSSREAVRSILGGLAFAIPGALVFIWHLREARRRDTRPIRGSFWGSSLYFHLVALIALSIALGGAVSLLHSLRDAMVPTCFDRPELEPLPPVATPIPGVPPAVEVPIGSVESPLLEPECYPTTSEALRSGVDALIVTGVAGVTWIWHVRRGRRLETAPAGP